MKHILFILFLCTFCATTTLLAQSNEELVERTRQMLKGGDQQPRNPLSATAASVPLTMSYQGLLTTSGGAPVADGDYALVFKLFDVATGGTAAWTETHATVPVQRGTFSVILGSTNSFNYFRFTRQLYIEVTATSGPAGPSYPLTFSPRSALASAPSSLAPWTWRDSVLFYSPDPSFGGGWPWRVGINNPYPLGLVEITGLDDSPNGRKAGLVLSNYGIGGGTWVLRSGGTLTNTGAFGFSISGGNLTDIDNYRLLIDRFGKVGIGTTTPSQKLEVAGTVYSTSGGFKFPDGTLQTTAATGSSSGWTDDGSTVRLTTDTDNVGIGTTTPSAPIHVVRDGSSSLINLESYGTFSSFRSTRAQGTLASPTAITNGFTLWDASLVGYTGSAFSSPHRLIYAVSTESWSPTANGYAISIRTTPNGTTTAQERMRVTDDGNVYINTSGTGAKLEVDGEIRNRGEFNGYSSVDRATGATAMIWYLDNDLLKFDDYSQSPPRMVLHRTSGHVGINTSSPQGALDINSTTGALIVPRMTTTERDALTAINGMIIYNTTDNQFNFYENGAWVTK